MKLYRIVSIIFILLEKKKVSASTLAEMFEVSIRTIYRDIDTLSMAGVPIYTEPGVNGGISILDNYKINNQVFNPRELVTMILGVEGIQATLNSAEATGLLFKLKQLIPDKQRMEIEQQIKSIQIDYTPWSKHKNRMQLFNTIQNAILLKQVIVIDYIDKSSTSSQRYLEPHLLVYKENEWYLQAYCQTKLGFRTFRLSRIKQIEVLEQTFELRDFIPLNKDSTSWIQNQIQPIKLKLDISLLSLIIDEIDNQDIEYIDSKTVIVTYPFVNDEYGYRRIIGLGVGCECIEPIEIRQGIETRLSKLIESYK